MSPGAERNDPFLAIIVIGVAAIAATAGYAPWLLASLILAPITVTILMLTGARPGLAARRAGGIGVMLLVPAGLQAYAFYRPFLHAYNPRHTILPLQAAWHLHALAHYPVLLGTLAVTGAALLAAAGLTYAHLQQRRHSPREHWAKVGDHSGQYPAGRRETW